MGEIHLTLLREMIERYKSPNENLDKWAKLVVECIKHGDIIVVCNSQSGANEEEFETGVKSFIDEFNLCLFCSGPLPEY